MSDESQDPIGDELNRLDAKGPRTVEQKEQDCRLVRVRRHDSFVGDYCAKCYGLCPIFAAKTVTIKNSALGDEKYPEPEQSDGTHNVFDVNEYREYNNYPIVSEEDAIRNRRRM